MDEWTKKTLVHISKDTNEHDSSENWKKSKKKFFIIFRPIGGGEPLPFGVGFLETKIEIQKSPRWG